MTDYLVTYMVRRGWRSVVPICNLILDKYGVELKREPVDSHQLKEPISDDKISITLRKCTEPIRSRSEIKSQNQVGNIANQLHLTRAITDLSFIPHRVNVDFQLTSTIFK